jgi:SHS2 domain-containing protein
LHRLPRPALGEALADALTELLVWLDADGWLPARVTAAFDGPRVRLAAFGESIRGRDLPAMHYPKAITRHGLRVVHGRARAGGEPAWRARLVVDL